MSLRIKHKHSEDEQVRVTGLIAEASGSVHRKKISLSLPPHIDFTERNHNNESISEINKQILDANKQEE